MTVKQGRPTNYTPELAKEICDTIACTSQGIKMLCKEHEHWPSHNTIYRWLTNHVDFSDLYARAKQLQIEVMIDEILEIADDISHDIVMDNNSNTTYNHEHINRSKLRIDTRKWLAAKLVPRVYGGSGNIMNVTKNEEANTTLERIRSTRLEYKKEY